jgi:hypothetical protein
VRVLAIRLVLAMAVAAWVALSGAGPARAADGASQCQAPSAQGGTYGQGIDSLLTVPDLRGGSAPTLAERYDTGAYTVHVDFVASLSGLVPGQAGGLDPAAEAVNTSMNVAAGEVTMLSISLGRAVVAIVEWTLSIDLPCVAGGALTGEVGGLATGIYQPLFGIACALVGLYVLWHGVARNRMMQGLNGALWALFAALVAGAFFAAPAEVMSGVDTFTGDVSRGVLALAAQGDPGLAAARSDPVYSASLAAQPDSDAELRLFADRWWRIWVYEPWTVVEFGNAADGQRYGEALLQAQQAQEHGDPGAVDRFVSTDLQSASPQTQDWFNGHDRGGRLLLGAPRLAVASLALVTLLIAGVTIVLVAGVLVVSQVALVVLAMVAPLFLLVGMVPGGGRALLVRLLELTAGALLMRILFSAFLAVVVVLGGVVNDYAGQLGWGVAAGLQLALTVTALIYRRPFVAVFSQVAHPRALVHHVGGSGAATAMAAALSGLMQRARTAPAGGSAVPGDGDLVSVSRWRSETEGFSMRGSRRRMGAVGRRLARSSPESDGGSPALLELPGPGGAGGSGAGEQWAAAGEVVHAGARAWRSSRSGERMTVRRGGAGPAAQPAGGTAPPARPGGRAPRAALAALTAVQAADAGRRAAQGLADPFVIRPRPRPPRPGQRLSWGELDRRRRQWREYTNQAYGWEEEPPW